MRAENSSVHSVYSNGKHKLQFHFIKEYNENITLIYLIKNSCKGELNIMKRIVKGMVVLLGICSISSLTLSSVRAEGQKDVYTTKDGVLSLDLPDSNWEEVSDSDTWITLSNGDDRITLLHYRNGEQLPDPVVADNSYAEVYQTYFSNRNEVFVITGYTVSDEDMTAVRNAINSIVVNKNSSSSKTLYYANSNAVTITKDSSGVWKDEDGNTYTAVSDDGSVWQNSVGSQLTTYDPYEAGELPEGQNTDIRNIKNEATNDISTIYKDNDGQWKDKDGNVYFYREDGAFVDSDGNEWFEAGELPEGQNTDIRNIKNEATNDISTIYEDNDGQWKDKDDNVYFHREDGAFVDSDGNEWFEY